VGYGTGFQQVSISDLNLQQDEQHLNEWLQSLSRPDDHGKARRKRQDELIPMRWGPPHAWTIGPAPHAQQGSITRHSKATSRVTPWAAITRIARAPGATGRKLISSRIAWLSRVRRSGPVLEKALARNAGLGWIGKHTNLINRHAGSWFFLGEILTTLPLPVDTPVDNHCGTCTACMDVCPTQAIVAPYQVDARRCISYLTIELRDSIPVEFRRAIGNRIYMRRLPAVLPLEQIRQSQQ
jgi:epoxyqueuosine reductase